jgi:hypothetical protein
LLIFEALKRVTMKKRIETNDMVELAQNGRRTGTEAL